MMKDKVNRILDDLNNNEKTNISEELRYDKEYQSILEDINSIWKLSREEIIERFNLVGDKDYTIDEQIEDLPRILDYEKRKKEGNLKLYSLDEIREELGL